MLVCLSLNIICSSKLIVFLELRSGNRSLLGTDNVRGQISEHFSASTSDLWKDATLRNDVK